VEPWHPLRGGPVRGQLVTDSRFLMAGPYSSRIRSIGPRARCLSSGKNHGPCIIQDSKQGSGQPWHFTCFRYWPLAGPSLTSSHSRVLWSDREPTGGPAFELLGVNGPWEHFQLHIPTYLRWPVAFEGEPSSGGSFMGKIWISMRSSLEVAM